MAIPAVLMQQLLELDDPQRAKIGYALLESRDDDCFVAAQELLATVDDGMTEAERAELQVELDLSMAEIAAGKGIPYDEAMASLRARSAARRAEHEPAR